MRLSHPIGLRSLLVALALLHPGTWGSGAAAADCGNSGNTLWNFTPVASQSAAAVGASGIYLAAGSTISLLSPATGSEINSTIFSGVTLRRPLCFELKAAVGSPSTTHAVLLTGSNGYAYNVHSTTLTTMWSQSLRRVGSVSDGISAPPVVQMWASSDAAYRAARTVDLVIIGTDYTGTTTANRVYALDASNGTPVWIFNPAGAYLLDTVHGLALDYARDLVYVVSDKHSMTPQNTVWGLSSINGTKIWARDLGPVDAPPVLAANRLYVATRAGELYALDPGTGTTLWQTTVTSTSQLTRLRVDTTSGQLNVYVLDSGGTLHAYSDPCAGFTPLWNYKPTGVVLDTDAGFLGGFVYVGGSDGKVRQIRASDGVANAFATVSVSGSQPCFDSIVIQDGLVPRLLASSDAILKKLCVPWPDTPGDKAFLLDGPEMDNTGPPAPLGVVSPAPDPTDGLVGIQMSPR